MADFAERAEVADRKRREAATLLEEFWRRGSREECQARALLPELRALRLFADLALVADRIARLHPKDATVRKLQVQALIETGHPTAAADVARAALRGLPESDREWSELYGLLGRAYKQILMDSRDPGDRLGQDTLAAALAAYQKPFLKNPGAVWHAINLVAVASFARRMSWKLSGQLDPEDLAHRLIDVLGKKIATEGREKCERWDFATLAEAHLAVGDLDGVERWLQDYLAAPGLEAFEVASTLRQFSQLWGLKKSGDPRQEGILQALHTRLLSLPGAEVTYSSRELADLSATRIPKDQLEAILGTEGTRSYEWWKTGLERAASVGAVYSDGDKRIGTCFLVRGEDLLGAPAPGAYVLTNAHVLSEPGRGGNLRPEDATVVFEALENRKHYRLDPAIVRFSPVDRHDACLVHLEGEPPDIPPLPLAKHLPRSPEDPPKADAAERAKLRVFVIGYPAGGGLEFSFQDNDLLDHEGKAAQPCRVHYLAPTQKGSSGSPVFNRGTWEVIALHHKGGELSRLKDRSGSYLANEGISMISIAAEFTTS